MEVKKTLGLVMRVNQINREIDYFNRSIVFPPSEVSLFVLTYSNENPVLTIDQIDKYYIFTS